MTAQWNVYPIIPVSRHFRLGSPMLPANCRSCHSESARTYTGVKARVIDATLSAEGSESTKQFCAGATIIGGYTYNRKKWVNSYRISANVVIWISIIRILASKSMYRWVNIAVMFICQVSVLSVGSVYNYAIPLPVVSRKIINGRKFCLQVILFKKFKYGKLKLN